MSIRAEANLDSESDKVTKLIAQKRADFQRCLDEASELQADVKTFLTDKFLSSLATAEKTVKQMLPESCIFILAEKQQRDSDRLHKELWSQAARFDKMWAKLIPWRRH